GRSGNERMPPRQVPALVDKPVRTCFGKPCEAAHAFGRELDAVLNLVLPGAVTGALARPEIEELASKARNGNVAGILIFEFDQAALPAAVAQRFPFCRGHFLKALRLPKRHRIAGLLPIFRSRIAALPF